MISNPFLSLRHLTARDRTFNLSSLLSLEYPQRLYFIRLDNLSQLLTCHECLEGNRHIYKSLTSDVLRNAFANEPTDTRWLPKNVIRHGSSVPGDWVVSYYPQQRYRLQIQSEQLYVPLPSLVFVGISNSYYVWAVKKIRFNSQLLIHYAPLPNVMNDGRVCWGNICPPIASLSNIESTWWKFIGSTFNQDYTQGKSIKFDNIIEQLKLQNRRARISNRSRYPTSDLIPIRDKLTVEEAVEYVTKSTK